MYRSVLLYREVKVVEELETDGNLYIFLIEKCKSSYLFIYVFFNTFIWQL